MKGKFIRVREQANMSNDWIVSQFYYTFDLTRRTQIDIGLHQEDERILGAEKRPFIDMSFVILKKQDNGTLKVVEVSETQTERDVEGSFELQPGSYIVVPKTTGALIKAPAMQSDPVRLKVNVDGVATLNKKANSALNDIFRKVDLQLDGLLTEKEINAFGSIVDEPLFKNLKKKDFITRQYECISCTEYGLTRFGLFQLLNSLSEDKLRRIFTKMGYDQSLYSVKSRVFVITFHSTSNIKVRI